MQRTAYGEISPVGPDEDVSGITLSPDGELLGACVQPQGIQLSPPRIQLWTVNPPGLHQSIPLSEKSSCGFGFTDGGRGIAYIDGEEIMTWDIAAGRVTTRKRPGPLPSPGAGVFERFLGSFAVAPDGRTAIYEAPYDGPYDGLSWWDLDQQAPLPGMRMSSPIHPAPISFTPDGRLATVDMGSAVLVVDVAQRMPLATHSIASDSSRGALSPDGRLIAASSGGRVITLTETAAHKGVPAEDAAHVAVQPDDEHLTTVSFTGEVAIHSLGEPQRIIVIPSADDEFDLERVEDLSPNGLRYAAAGDPAHQIRLWDLSSSPAPEVPLEGHRGDVLRLSFDSSSDFLASADESEVIIWSAKDRAEVSRIPLPKGYTTTGLAVSPKGRYIATSSSDGQTLLWDTTSNNLASTSLPVEGTTSLTFSPDGR